MVKKHDSSIELGDPLSGSSKRTKRDRRFSVDDATFHKFMTERELAVSWLQDYLPELDDAFELDGLRIEPNEFHDQNLTKQIADAVYSIPKKGSSARTYLALILEHKSRIRPSERRATLLQTASYLISQCARELERGKSSKRLLQPIVASVYTGSDRSITELRWEDEFYLPSSLERFGGFFNLQVVNMGRLLQNGKSPKNEWLDVMYNVMTRSKSDELDGYENVAYLPLLRHTGEWSGVATDRLTALTTLYSAHIQKANLSQHDERIASLFHSIDLEEKMGTDALYRMFAPAAERAGFIHGEESGVRKGIQQGIQQERDATLAAQRSELDSAIRARFGACPVALRRSVDKIVDLNALINLRLFALTDAKSTNDVLERAKTAIQ